MCCWKMIRKLLNIIIGWWFRITGSNYDLYKSRIDICNSCEYKKILLGDEVCSVCGCFLKAKARVKNEKCMLNKWE